jgi:hypothetical protein
MTDARGSFIAYDVMSPNAQKCRHAQQTPQHLCCIVENDYVWYRCLTDVIICIGIALSPLLCRIEVDTHRVTAGMLVKSSKSILSV